MVAVSDCCTTDTIGDKTRQRQEWSCWRRSIRIREVDLWSASLFVCPIRWSGGIFVFTSTEKGDCLMTTTHEFDAHCDIVAMEEPDYHEQLLVMQEMEEAMKWTPAVVALEGLRERLVFFENAYAKEDQELLYITAALGAYQIAIDTLDQELNRYRRWAGLPTVERGGVA
jgi:hypothetical protein